MSEPKTRKARLLLPVPGWTWPLMLTPVGAADHEVVEAVTVGIPHTFATLKPAAPASADHGLRRTPKGSVAILGAGGGRKHTSQVDRHQLPLFSD